MPGPRASETSKRTFLVAALLSLAVTLPPLAARAANLDADRAQSVAELLEAGRVSDAVARAEAAVRESPESGLLRRRLAQAHLCRAMERDNRLGASFDQARLGSNLASLTSSFRLLPAQRPLKYEKERENYTLLLGILEGPQVQELQEQGRRALTEAGPLLRERTEAWSASLEALKEAARLGDSATEARLTELWARVTALAWLREGRELTAPKDPQARIFGDDVEKVLNQALEPLRWVKAEDLLRDAASLGKEREADPHALAGAADVLSMVGPLAAKTDPLLQHTQALLGGRYLKNRATYIIHLMPNTRASGRALYRQAQAVREPDPVEFHWILYRQLYEHALELDRERKLPFLRERVYLLRAPFDEAGAAPLLAEMTKQEPQNAVVPLERARKLLLLDEDFAAGMIELRRTAAMPRFSRSFLTALPEPLRLAVRFQRVLREQIGRDWPTFGGMLTTVEDAQRAKPSSSQATDLLLLRQRLSMLLAQSGDYLEQRTAIWAERGALEELMDPHNPLSETDRAGVSALRAQRDAANADFPMPPASLNITPGEGVAFLRNDRYYTFKAPCIQMGPLGVASILLGGANPMPPGK